MSTAFIGCGFEDEDRPFSALELQDDTTEIRVQELSSFCTVQVQGHGAVDVENDYIPNSIACENGNAPLEALKLQAIAARTYAKFITENEKRPLQPNTRDQMYKCSYAKPKDIHFQAARETAGQVLTHKGKLIASFYVAGSMRSGATCGAGSDPTKTEKWVTYNQGRSGGAVRATPLGNINNPANRGAMSQNGSSCWAKNGWKHDRIARYYYGDDIRIEALPGQCSGGSSAPPVDACDFGPSTAATAPSCTSSGQAPNILPRSAWGAKAPRGYYGKHTPNRITIHHTVTSNSATDSAAEARKIQQMHFNNGWNDVGYHFMIGRDGKIYRGSAEDRLGTHVANQNTGNLGIVLIGTYHESTAPTDAQLKSAAQLVGYLGRKYKITLNRTNVKGHGERMATLCPGKQVLSRMNKILEWANADSVCTNPGQTPSNPNGSDNYRYVRVVSTSDSPSGGANDTVNGFEVDAIHFERTDSKGVRSTHYAKGVKCSPGVSNPNGGVGKPDNTTCDNRKSTVAGVPVGATYVVELPTALKNGDQLHITQNTYRTSMNECSPSGTAKISISQDGKIWKSVSPSVKGNSTIKITDAHFKAAPEEDTTGGGGSFTFTSPKAGQWYTPDMTFTVSTSNPNIVKVKYLAEDDWKLGESTNRGNGFKVTYPYQFYGQRNSIAIGYDASGKEIARASVGFTVTKKDGSIPKGKTNPGPVPSGQVNTELANKLKVEGGKCKNWQGGAERCKNGTGGYSTGQCWAFVKGALQRAGVNFNKLANAGPCTSYQFALSAYGFGCNANANPAILSSIGLKKISVAPSKAPAGAVITYGAGCMGAHKVHGHIEVSMGNGVACSDYCGKIRAGNSSCASVFAPIK